MVTAGKRHCGRLNPDGSLDGTFTQLTFAESGTISGMAIQTDGKIVLAGFIDPILTRIRPNGTVDTAFHPAFDSSNTAWVDHVFVLPDGGILLDRTVEKDGPHHAARLKSDGTLDASFKPGLDTCELVAAQPDGKILAYGQWIENGVPHEGFNRLNRDGSIDASFSLEVPDYFSAAIRPDGKLALAGQYGYRSPNMSSWTPELLCLNNDGSLDRNFDFSFNSDHTIRAMVRQGDGKTVIGGDFDTICGIRRNRIARLNLDNTLDLTFDPGAGMNGSITGLGIQPDGKLVIIGDFTRAAGVTRTGIARFNEDGSLDASFNPQVNGVIDGIAMRPNGKFILLGSFSSINGVSRASIARMNANGSVDTTFVPGASDGPLTCMAVEPDEKILIGGSRRSGTRDAAKLRRLGVNGTVEKDFESNLKGGAATIAHITTLRDGKFLAAEFVPKESDSDHDRTLLCRYHANGTTDTAFQSDLYQFRSGSIDALVEDSNGSLLVGGNFSAQSTLMAAIPQLRCFVRLNSSGIPDPGFKGTNATTKRVRAICLRPDGNASLAGDFVTYHGAHRHHFAYINPDGSLNTTTSLFASAPDGEVNALATGTDGNIVICGKFSSVYQYPLSGAVRMSAGGDLNSTFTANLRDVSALVVQRDGKVVVCDRPTTGSETRVITRRNANGTTDSTFSKAIVDGAVKCITVQPDGGLIIAGDFHRVKGQVRNQIARINANGMLDQTFNPGDGVDLGEIVVPDDGDENNDWIYHQSRGRINSIAVQPDGKIVIVGMFDRVAGTDRKNIARLNSNGVHDVAFDPGAGTDDEVLAVAFQPDGKALIAGTFRKAGGAARNGIARLKSDGSLDGAFAPDSFEFDYFQSLAIQADGRILAAGYYHSNNGCGRIVRLNPDGSINMMFETPDQLVFEFGGINAIALQCDGKLLAGGLFGNIGTTARRNLARISNPDAALQQLIISPGAIGVTWKLGGSFPQPFQVLFEDSIDGKNWNVLGWGSPVPGVGFRLGYLSLPIETSHYIRATGWSTGGQNNGSISVHQSTLWFVATHYNAVTDWACYR